ncbi:MAG: hypothetical protein E4H01_11400, partial [Lysobacterales bacterium]
MKKLLILTLALLTMPALCAVAADYGVFVDGGYSPGRTETDMDRLVDGRIDEAMRIMGVRQPGSQRSRVDTRQGLI